MSQAGFDGDGSGAPASGHLDYPCDACGSYLKFEAGTTSLRCPYCGHQQEVVVAAGAVVREHSFAEWAATAAEAAAGGKPTGHVGRYAVRCSGCGAHTETDKLSDACPFCGASIVLEPDAAEMITPEAVLPFAVREEKALEHFREWIASRWFAPNSLRTLAAHEKIQGTYLPHWTFDSDTTTMYRGQRGDYYYTTEWYTDSDGKQQTRQVRNIRWYPAFGSVGRVFDDVLVPAVKSLPADDLAELEPWDMGQVTAYRPDYLAGFQTLRYEIEPPQGLDLFQRAVRATIENDCRADIGGDEQRLESVETDWNDVTFKLLLLPAWLAAYRYQDKVWRVMINARTGEVIGQRPWSVAKIAAAVLAAVAVLAALAAAYALTRR
jgi:DNA-directed RNA polymerase subunit RPC12/RpoP